MKYSHGSLLLAALLCSPVLAQQPQPGFPRDWEGGLGVSPHSVVNLRNGNLITSLKLIEWRPVGPAVRFAVYHNSAAATAGESGVAGQGFTLGAGWSTSYSGHIVDNSSTVTVIEDDGTKNVFTASGGDYIAPAGVYDRLVLDAGNSQWVLTRPDQSVRRFDQSGGWLVTVEDPHGNILSLERDENNDHRIIGIVSAAEDSYGAHHRLALEYSDSRLQYMWEDSDPSPERYWSFDYDDSNRLSAVRYFTSDPDDPNAPSADFAYVSGASCRLETVTNRENLTWTYSYVRTARHRDRSRQRFAGFRLHVAVPRRTGRVHDHNLHGPQRRQLEVQVQPRLRLDRVSRRPPEKKLLHLRL